MPRAGLGVCTKALPRPSALCRLACTLPCSVMGERSQSGKGPVYTQEERSRKSLHARRPSKSRWTNLFAAEAFGVWRQISTAASASTVRKTCSRLCLSKTKTTWTQRRLSTSRRIPQSDGRVPGVPPHLAPRPLPTDAGRKERIWTPLKGVWAADGPAANPLTVDPCPSPEQSRTEMSFGRAAG